MSSIIIVTCHCEPSHISTVSANFNVTPMLLFPGWDGMVPILNVVAVKSFGLFCLPISFLGVWMGWDILWVRTTGVATAQKLF